MKPRPDTGTANGDPCPANPEHGRMFALASGRQFCAHSDHSSRRDPAIFLHDGLSRPDGWIEAELREAWGK